MGSKKFFLCSRFLQDWGANAWGPPALPQVARRGGESLGEAESPSSYLAVCLLPEPIDRPRNSGVELVMITLNVIILMGAGWTGLAGASLPLTEPPAANADCMARADYRELNDREIEAAVVDSRIVYDWRSGIYRAIRDERFDRQRNRYLVRYEGQLQRRHLRDYRRQAVHARVERFLRAVPADVPLGEVRIRPVRTWCRSSAISDEN